MCLLILLHCTDKRHLILNTKQTPNPNPVLDSDLKPSPNIKPNPNPDLKFTFEEDRVDILPMDELHKYSVSHISI